MLNEIRNRVLIMMLPAIGIVAFLPFPTTALAQSSAAPPPGALIRMDMNSVVGVKLDDIPGGEAREEAADWALSQEDDFWEKRASTQVNLTYYRLVFRTFYYPVASITALPLPPHSGWHIDLVGDPRRMQIGTHDYVAVKYHFWTYIVTDAASADASQPGSLDRIGGTWDEPFDLPADPELVIQRSGWGCIDEFGYPPNSVFEESVYYFYDQSCQVETPATSACHITHFPTESCVDALKNHIGLMQPNMHFTRVAYNPELASDFRVGTTTNPTGPDLAAIQEALTGEHNVYYRFFAPDSCDIKYGTIAQPGWRRLLTFSTNTRNDGARPLHIGDLTDPNNPWRTSNLYEFGSCDQEWTFHFYVNFDYNTLHGVKRAFCIEDTNRYHNDESTPLAAVYQSCNLQGISAGWGDEYQFGISGQWVDVTNVDTSQPHDLSFDLNPQNFLCEGQALDIHGQPVDPTNLNALVFDPTALKDAQGNTISRIRCQFASNYAANNVAKVSVSQKGTGAFVNDDCTRGQVGPVRDCGFTLPSEVHSCAAGSQVKLLCRTGGSKQVLRVCEASAVLGVGIPCTFQNSVSNTIVDGDEEAVTFICPSMRDAAVPGAGGYSTSHAPLVPGQQSEPVSIVRF